MYWFKVYDKKTTRLPCHSEIVEVKEGFALVKKDCSRTELKTKLAYKQKCYEINISSVPERIKQLFGITEQPRLKNKDGNRPNRMINNQVQNGNKIAIITCITGDKNNFKQSEYNPKIDYYLYTDVAEKYNFNNINVKQVSFAQNDIIKAVEGFEGKQRRYAVNLLLSQKVKIIPDLKQYDYTVWIYGSMSFIKDPMPFLDEVLDKDHALFVFKHGLLNGRSRNCVYEEIEAWNNLNKYYRVMRDRAKKRCIRETFPKDFGLYGGGVHIKNHKHPDLQKFLDDWWWDILNITFSDQLSLPYMLWKTELPIKIIGKQFDDNHNRYIKYWKHIYNSVNI